MFIKKLDMISPPITLFFKGEGSHVSIFSGLLSLIGYVIVVVAAIYYALGFINRDSPKAYFFTRYVEDAGTFPVNATQMFHFIQVSDPSTNQKVPLDFQAFRIVGFDTIYAEDYSTNPAIIETINHWVYGNCNNSSDTKGISYLINQKYYDQSACIRKYYDAKKKKYYETGEDGFVWPVIVKGCSHPDRTYYGIIMQRCDKASKLIQDQGPECKTATEINQIIESVSFNFQIIDHYADMLNYEMPFTKYFYEITSALADNYFAIQHLNFNPANMLTHNGFFFDNQVKEEAYFFTQNDKQNIEDLNKINGCLIGVFYWMQNTLQYYERNYDRVQDVLSDIGGISSIVLTVVAILNLLIHNFIVLLDTEDLVLSTDQENYNNQKELNKRPTILRKANEVMFPPRRPYQARNPYGNDSQQQQASSNYQRLMKDGVDIYPNMNSRDEKNEQYKNLYLKRNILLNNNNNYDTSKNAGDNYQDQGGYNRGGGRNANNLNRGNYRQQQGGYIENTVNKSIKDENTTEKREEFDVENLESRPIEKQNFDWCKYLGYLICCGRNDKRITYYEDFRAKIISEENIMLNYFDHTLCLHIQYNILHYI